LDLSLTTSPAGAHAVDPGAMWPNWRNAGRRANNNSAIRSRTSRMINATGTDTGIRAGREDCHRQTNHEESERIFHIRSPLATSGDFQVDRDMSACDLKGAFSNGSRMSTFGGQAEIVDRLIPTRLPVKEGSPTRQATLLRTNPFFQDSKYFAGNNCIFATCH